MTNQFRKALAAVVMAAAVTPSLARAECVRISPKALLAREDAELVFAGRVVDVTRTSEFGSRATFEVERVWAGKVPRRFEVYMWDLASAEAPRYTAGEKYVAAAKRLQDQRAREGVGLGGRDVVAFTGVPCSDGYSIKEFIRSVGPGKAPIDEGSGPRR